MGGQLHTADFDGDGKTDIIAFENELHGDLPCPVAFYHSNGSSRRSRKRAPAEWRSPSVTSTTTASATSSCAPPTPSMSFLAKATDTHGLDIVDVDGNADLAFMSKDTFYVFYGDGTGHFPRVASFDPGGQELLGGRALRPERTRPGARSPAVSSGRTNATC